MRRPNGGVLQQPISKDDVAKATRVIVRTGQVSPIMLQRHLKLGYTKAVRIIAMLEGANIVGPAQADQPRAVLLKNEEQAVNAALRRFNTGKRRK